jgi:hypothetical protein
MIRMTETVKVEVDEGLAKRFRKRAMERYGYKKGAVKKALEEAMKRYISAGDVDWKPLRGTLDSRLDSVALQHSAWKKPD